MKRCARVEEPTASIDVALCMDITVEIHCDKCGSANLSLPARDDEGDAIACNDCGEGHGTLATLREDLFACAIEQSSERLRAGLERLTPT